MRKNTAFRQFVVRGLRVVAAVLILVVLFYFKFIDLAVLAKILKQPLAVVVVVTLIFASFITGTLRWLLILRAQGFNVAFFRLFNFYTLGIFSSIFLPGGTGSADGVRAVLLVRAVPNSQGRAVLTVVFDRFCAVFTLSIMAAIFGVLSRRESAIPFYWLRIAAIALPFMLMGGAVFAYVLTLYFRNRPWTRKFENRLPWQVLSAAAGFIELIALNPRRVVSALFFSAVTTSLLIVSVIVVGAASDVPHLTLTDLGEATALSMFANGVPITPGGIGVGEAAFNQICAWLADPAASYPYGTIFLGYRVMAMATACYGLIPLVTMGKSVYERQR